MNPNAKAFVFNAGASTWSPPSQPAAATPPVAQVPVPPQLVESIQVVETNVVEDNEGIQQTSCLPVNIIELDL